LLAIPKALTVPPTTLMQTTENQGFLIWVGCCCGVLDIALDVLLTPHYGARGAAAANGAAQLAAAIAIWVRARGLFRLDLRLGEFGRIVLSAAAMGAVTVAISRWLPTYWGMALAFCAAVVTWFVSLRVTGAVSRSDGERILMMGKVLPGRLRILYRWLVGWLAAAA
jgi:O-antigen/teichoic acid export membrane protein